MENSHHSDIHYSGKPLEEASKVLIMLHGRGGDAGDILGLAAHLRVEDFALLAPQATNHSWYPYSFLAAPVHNEPWLSSALGILHDQLRDLVAAGITTNNIFFLGFSQGACLALEFAARNAARYGGVVAFTGGLIGDRLYTENYRGDFDSTPIFIGSGDPDPHVPVERVEASARQLTAMHASVTKKIYPQMGHTITSDEIAQANRLIFAPRGQVNPS